MERNSFKIIADADWFPCGIVKGTDGASASECTQRVTAQELLAINRKPLNMPDILVRKKLGAFGSDRDRRVHCNNDESELDF